MTSLETTRKRLRFRAWHRGTREADLLLGRFADARIDGFDEEALGQFEALLNESDVDIWNWVTGREPIAEHARSAVLMALCDSAVHRP